MNEPRKLSYRELVMHEEGEITISEAEEQDAQLAMSPTNQQRRARVDRVLAHLEDTSEVDEIDLLPRLRERLSEENAAHRPVHRRILSPRHAALAAATAALLLLPTILLWRDAPPSTTQTEEFRTKSAGDHIAARARWIALNVFHLSNDAAPERLTNLLNADDGLLFTYTNLGPQPFSHLMIFAVDKKHQVYWYYPAFLDVRDDPKGITIEKGGSRVGLHEVVVHRFQEGPLTLFGLFSDRPYSVSEVESAVQNGVTDSAGFEARFTGSRVKTVKTEVVK